MLDENLPTFRLRPSSDDPLASILYFSQHGSDPAAEYLLQRANPAVPASRSKYGIALCDPSNTNVVYGEVTVEPEWSQPTLSGAEIRAQAQTGAAPTTVVAMVPDSFTVQLYNPEQSVTVKMAAGSWNKSDSWEFELPIQTFRTPTTSALDREQQNTSPAVADLIPRVMFKWKRDGLLSKDMTCYMTGKREGTRKSKEPDITIGMFKAARESILTVYQPNLHRVEVEDKKGLELVLLLASEVIKDLWLIPKSDVFNVQGGGPPLNGNKRKNSRPVVAAPAVVGSSGTPAMSGALANVPPPQAAPSSSAQAVSKASTPPPPKPEIDAETRRLQAMVEREQREREKAERAEQKRIKKMIEDEEKERRRREAEVAKETERLRKEYGVEGQDLPSDRPPLPPRGAQPNQQQQASPPPPGPPYSPQQQLSPWGYAPTPMLPPRPVSAGPHSQQQQQQHGPPPGHAHAPPGQQQQQQQQGQGQGQQGPFRVGALNALWKGAAGGLQQLQSQVQQHQGSGSGSGQRHGRRKSEEEGGKVKKKRSSHW